ncbi:glycosyltransferase [Streptomyces sp. NPDC046977]|uniref:glycosyltransferase n=1 Tax=Streptomyces sp. NPDC046977 TaxID=3154703 RepID=UPI0033C7B4EC
MLAALLHLGWYGYTVGAVLGAKLLLSAPIPRPWRSSPRTRRQPTMGMTVHGVITVYNEDPAMLRRCLQSVLAQTRRPDSLTVVDDCSADHSASALIDQMRTAFDTAGIALTFIRFPANRGKRHGLAAAFRQSPAADAYLAVDSDTILGPDAVEQLLRPMARRRVHAVTGLVLAHNRSVNLLTRLIDMRYVNAFLGERVAYSRLGSVLCACGSLALYRGWVMRKYLDDFLDQQFLGRPATFGDDRRLTYYALTEGQSLIAPTAVGYTDVPEHLGHYVRQQIRWGRSFIREGVLLLAQVRFVPRAFWWINLVEVGTWIGFTAGLLTTLVLAVVHPAGWHILTGYALAVCVMAWIRSVHYLRRAPGVPKPDRLLTFAAAPLYALLNLGLLLPLRLWSLATLHATSWGTRQNGAEVHHTEQAPTAEPAAPTFAPAPAAYDADAITEPIPLIPAARADDDTVPLHKLLDPLDARTLELDLRTR